MSKWGVRSPQECVRHEISNFLYPNQLFATIRKRLSLLHGKLSALVNIPNNYFIFLWFFKETAKGKKNGWRPFFTNPRSTCPILLWRFHQKNPWPLSGWSLVPRLKAARHFYPTARTKRAHEAKKLGKNLYGIHWIPWLFDDGILTNGLW